MVRGVALALVILLSAGPAGAQLTRAPAPGQPLKLFPSELDEFAKFVEADPLVKAHADRLVSQRRWGRAVSIGGALVGLGLIVPGAFLRRDCRTIMDPAMPRLDCSDRDRSNAFMISGGVLGLGLFALGLVISPSRGDFEGAIAAWNARHPDAPIALGR